MIRPGSFGKRELFPRIGFLVTHSKLPAGKVVEANNGPGDVENKIKEGKNTLCCGKTDCLRFIAHQARLLMGVLSDNLPHMVRQAHLVGETIKPSMEWLIKRLIKVEAKESWHGRKWCVHVASAFPLARLTSLCSGDGDDGKMVGEVLRVKCAQ
jgi:hypothetical protein